MPCGVTRRELLLSVAAGCAAAALPSAAPAAPEMETFTVSLAGNDEGVAGAVRQFICAEKGWLVVQIHDGREWRDWYVRGSPPEGIVAEFIRARNRALGRDVHGVPLVA